MINLIWIYKPNRLMNFALIAFLVFKQLRVFQNQSNTRNWFSVFILISKQGNSDANNYGTINNGYFIWCTFGSFCNKESLFLKKNPNLARIFLFILCYQLNITKYHKRNIIIVFYCLLMFMYSRKKDENAEKLVGDLA